MSSLNKVISSINESAQRIQVEATMLRALMIEHHRALGFSVLNISNHTNGIIEHAENLKRPMLTFKDVVRRAAELNDDLRDDNHPDNHDRDAGRVCPSCDHDLELNADFQCVRCGSHS